MTQTTITTGFAPRSSRSDRAPMTPVVRQTTITYIGGPSSGRTRRECWNATSEDGTWDYSRIEDDGTNWYVTHNPTGYQGDQPYLTLDSARRATCSGAALDQMIVECEQIVGNDRWPADCRADAETSLFQLRAASREGA
jgi:hypothetical protein